MTTDLLNESFDTTTLHPGLRWFCEPSEWSIDTARSCLRIAPDAGTDFWQKTHYGFEADNGHFLFIDVAGDVVMTGHVRFSPRHQYDQAGLMVRVSSTCWLKTSVEYEPDEPSRLGAVVTNGGYSDWSTQQVPTPTEQTWLRITRSGSDCTVESSLDGTTWQQIRVAHLHEASPGSPMSCGLYACSPKGRGLVAEFSFLRIAATERATS